MITFKRFLSENVYHPTAVSVDQAVAWLKANASKSLEASRSSRNWFYRGAKYSEFFGLIDSRKFNRVSANTLNTYTIWFDNNPMWKDFPKRSKGLVCTSSRNVASGFVSFRSPYLVIPSDDSHVGVVWARDFWDAFPATKELVHDLDDFVRTVNRLARAYFYVVGGETMDKARLILDNLASRTKNVSYEDLVWVLKSITSKEMSKILVDQPRVFKDWSVFIATFTEKYDSMYELFEDVLSPKNATLSTAMAPTAIKMVGDSNEVWITGPCFVIRENTLDSLRHSDSAIDNELYALIREK